MTVENKARSRNRWFAASSNVSFSRRTLRSQSKRSDMIGISRTSLRYSSKIVGRPVSSVEKGKASRGRLRMPGAPTPFLRQRETIFDGGSISKLFSPRAVILSAATAVRGTLRRPMPWMGVPPLHTGSRSSHHYNRLTGFRKVPPERWERSCGTISVGESRKCSASN